MRGCQSMSLKEVVSKIAPALGSVIGTLVPGGSAIVNGIASLFGADPTNPDDIAAKIKQDPEAYLKLVQFEKEHEAEILELQLKDRQSARARELDMVKTTGKRDWVVATLAISVLGGYFLMVGLSCLHGLPNWASGLLRESLAEWKMCVMLVLSYYFGAMNKGK